MSRDPLQEQLFDYELLSRLAQSPTPVGATTLVFDLGAAFDISQASIGRKLRELDVRGLTRRTGNRGRELTAAGEAQRLELERRLAKQRHNSDLMVALNATDQQTLLDVLVARRGLEREIARLAAQRATAEDITALRRSVADQERAIAAGQIPSAEDIVFHNRLAQASGNKVLFHALQLVRAESSYSPEVASMRQWVGGQLVTDHRLIVECVASGSAGAAEEAVVQHITKLIDDVRRYFAVHDEQEQSAE